ncbi:MAG TPA: hypothetical protein VFW11_05820 [Cyclobacteriaceae bacterium]|nr:hypothetical protein [Cyclobacteriaceae bacterium]
MKTLFSILLLIVVFSSCERKEKVQQIIIDRIAKMPDHPSPYKMTDWYEKAHHFDQYVFNPELKGDFFPLIWIDSAKRNFKQNTLGMYTVIGDVRQGPKGSPEFHEAICAMGSIMSAGLVGIDKTNQNGVNYVLMLQNYFNSESGWNIMMNNTNPKVAMLGGGYGRDWWYDVFPNVLYYAICDLNRRVPRADSLQRIIAEQFYKADSVLHGNYDYSYFDYSKLQGMSNQIPHQQDVAAGHAYVMLCAYEKFGDERYLKGAKSAMDAFVNQKESRFYEVLMPFGALVASRLNAEHGTHYDVKKILDWTFEGCKAKDGRTGWGVIAERWGDYDVYGLQGSITDGGGYAFLMNSFDLAWPLVPMAKYDTRFANAVGKWMLNLTNAARLFYPYEIDDQHQWLASKKDITKNVIAYEGIRKADDYLRDDLKGVTPVAIGDGPKWTKGQPDISMFSLYSSAQVGILGSIVRTTNVDQILQLNCNATDFYGANAFPTYLYYNPYDSAKSVCFNKPDKNDVDLYDAITQEALVRHAGEESCFDIPGKSSRVLVVVPADMDIDKNGGKYLLNDKEVAYRQSDER